MKPKVVQVGSRFHPCIGGVEKFMEELSLHLSKKFEVRVVCLNKCPNNPKILPAKENFKGIQVKRLSFLDLKYYKLAPAVLKEVKPADLIHIHGIGFYSDFILLAKALGLIKAPVLVSTHGGIWHTRKLAWLKKIYFNLWTRLILRQANKVVAVSKADFKMFSGILPPKKLVLIENAVGLEKFRQIKRKTIANSFAFVGRLSSNKGLDDLLKTMAELSQEKFSLSIIGNDFEGLQAGLEKQAEKLGLKDKVKFYGRLEAKEMQQVLAESEFFVSASKQEGFGLSAIEGMAAGLIPLLNDIAAFNDFIASGENGFIIDFKNKEKSAQQIRKIMRLNPKTKKLIAEKAKAFALKFDWKNKIKDWENIYWEALNESNLFRARH